MKKYITIICTFFASYLQLSLAFANNFNKGQFLDLLNKEQHRQQNFLKFQKQEKQRINREKKKPKIKNLIVDESILDNNSCFNIFKIELENVNNLSNFEIKKITNNYINKCLSTKDISDLMKKINNQYIQKAYITSHVMLKPQDLQTGILKLSAFEGKIENIILNDNQQYDSIKMKMLLPFKKNKILNLKDLEQAMEQINRLESSNATLQIKPATKELYSNIYINNKPINKNRFYLSYNNSGQKITGKDKISFLNEHDNLFGIGDYINLNYNQSKKTKTDFTKAISLYTSIPFGYWTFSANFSHLKYNNNYNLVFETLQSSGQTDSITLNANNVIYRDINSKISTNIGFTHKNTKTIIGSEEVQTGTRTLSILKLGTDITYRLFDSILYLDLGYQIGTDWFGARKDKSNINIEQEKAQFRKITFDGNFYKPFKIQDQQFTYRSQISGQYSFDNLFNSEKINIGDKYTVRGFSEESIIGDIGAYVRNELSWHIPKITNDKYFNKITGHLETYIAYDFGSTILKIKDDKYHIRRSSIGGFAIGLRNKSDWLSYDITYAKAAFRPSFMQDNKELNYIEAKIKFAF